MAVHDFSILSMAMLISWLPEASCLKLVCCLHVMLWQLQVPLLAPNHECSSHKKKH